MMLLLPFGHFEENLQGYVSHELQATSGRLLSHPPQQPIVGFCLTH